MASTGAGAAVADDESKSAATSEPCSKQGPFSESPANENGVTAVRVMLCPVDSSHRVESVESSLSSGKATPLAGLDPFAEEKGLSCLSLEVLTSGEHLDMLSLDGLDDDGEEGGEGEEEEEGIPECEGQVQVQGEPYCDAEQSREEGEGMREEGRGGGGGGAVAECESERCGDDRQTRCSDGVTEQETSANSLSLVVEVSCHTPSDNSRCSSSMGYLEPRPHPHQQQLSSNGNQLPSPKDIQKRLMEKVTRLSPEGAEDVVQEEEGGVVEEEGGVVKGEEGTEEEACGTVSTLSSSRSSQSLNSTGATSRGVSFSSIFKRRRSLAKTREHNPETMAATSTTGLILHDRPKTLPAKSPAEEHRHQKLHQEMMAAARKKELQKAKQEVQMEKRRRERDKQVADSLLEWERVLLKWESLYNVRKVRELWWQGLPPGVRGKVWKRAIGNDLLISSDLYLINLRRCKERLASARQRSDSTASQSSVSREQSVEVIHLDVLRTFPTLGFFQEGGPYNQSLCDVLGAYACYRPDIGYVQGMSFLAGVLLLNMDAGDAFISLANLLNRPSYLAFFKVDHSLMQPYFNTFATLLHDNLPKLSTHFLNSEFSPEYYLIEWIFTIYTRVLPLDVACRVWDLFCRDGDSFLFRTALGILKLYQSRLLERKSIEEMGQFLGNLPANMDSDALFAQIDSIHSTPKKFKQILAQEQSKPQSGSAS